MKYSIYRVQDDVDSHPFDETIDLNLSIRDGVYIFYKHSDHQPEVVYPIGSFWVLRETM